jgi:hypothetical protein
VLEDAISKQIQAAASKVFRYTGTIDLANFQDGGNLTAAINEFANVDIGSWINIVNSSSTNTASKIYDVGAGGFSLQAGDALVVSSKTPLLVDVVEDSKSVVASKPVDLSITVERGADNEYVLSVSDSYRDEVTKEIDDMKKEIVDSAVTQDDIDAAVLVEKNRALAAEGTLTTDLATEVSNRALAISTVTDLVTDEVDRATAAEGTLRTDLSAETTRATGEEARIEGLVTDEVSTARAAELKLTNDLADEVRNRGLAVAAEVADRQAAVSGERTRAETAEQANATAISGEKLRAEIAEIALGSRIDTEKSRAEGEEARIEGKIDAEKTRAELAEGVLTTELAAVKTRAEAADAEHAADIANIESAAESLSASVISQFATSDLKRVNAVTALNGNIASVNTALTALITAASTRLDILEAFVAHTEQFVQLSDGQTVLDFSGSLAALADYPAVVTVTAAATA